MFRVRMERKVDPRSIHTAKQRTIKGKTRPRDGKRLRRERKLNDSKEGRDEYKYFYRRKRVTDITTDSQFDEHGNTDCWLTGVSFANSYRIS